MKWGAKKRGLNTELSKKGQGIPLLREKSRGGGGAGSPGLKQRRTHLVELFRGEQSAERGTRKGEM